MALNFFTILTIISIFLTAALSLFFFINKRGFVTENRILAALLVIFNLQIFYSYMTSFYAPHSSLPWHKLLFLIRQTSFLIGPLIYFYSNSFLKRRDIFRYNSSLHFLPFAFALMFLALYYRNVDRFIIWESILDLDFTILILTHNLIYIVLSVLAMKTETTGFKELYKNVVSSSQSKWLHLLLIGFILIWIVNLNSFALYMIIRRPGWCAYTSSIYALMVFLFINTVMFVLLLKPDIYFVVAKYKNTKIETSEKQEYLQQLTAYMEKEKPYLNPDITIETLARELGMHTRLLSQIINETYKKNFKGFILEYRIRESMEILADSHQADLTVLEILYQVGFNSKSAFNNQFKLYTNLTPLEYRAQFVRAGG
jgi:AraC-like DNA-binding protein